MFFQIATQISFFQMTFQLCYWCFFINWAWSTNSFNNPIIVTNWPFLNFYFICFLNINRWNRILLLYELLYYFTTFGNTSFNRLVHFSFRYVHTRVLRVRFDLLTTAAFESLSDAKYWKVCAVICFLN